MARTAIVIDSAADMPAEVAAEAGITIVPLIISFGSEEWRAGTELSMDQFYDRLTAPGAPFPKTAACGPGDFKQAFEAALADGADGVVCVTVGSKLSATIRSAELARDEMPGQPVHVVDSNTASMGQGVLALLGADMANAGEPADTIAETLRRRAPASHVYVALDTLEYLRRGGRIGAAQAAIGSVLSVKPIIEIRDGVVETVDKPRTRSRARARLLEILAEQPAEMAWILHSRVDDLDAFMEEAAGALRLPRTELRSALLGPSVAPHVGPGAVGAAVLFRDGTAAA